MNVNAGTITSSPGPTPSAASATAQRGGPARRRERVPAPERFAHGRLERRDAGRVRAEWYRNSVRSRSTAVTASISSSPRASMPLPSGSRRATRGLPAVDREPVGAHDGTVAVGRSRRRAVVDRCGLSGDIAQRRPETPVLPSCVVDVDRQMQLLTAGAVDVIAEQELRTKLAPGPAAAGEARHRPDRVRHPPRLRRRAAPPAPVPGPRPRRGADPRRLHRAGRRPVGPFGDPAPPVEGGGRRARADLPRAGRRASSTCRPSRLEVRRNSEWLGAARHGRRPAAHVAGHRRPHARARRLRQALRERRRRSR